jgi:hypothetical protein
MSAAPAKVEEKKADGEAAGLSLDDVTGTLKLVSKVHSFLFIHINATVNNCGGR